MITTKAAGHAAIATTRGAAGLSAHAQGEQRVKLEDVFNVECYSHRHFDGSRCLIFNAIDDRTGLPLCRRPHKERLEWRDVVENTVVTAGLNHLMSRLSLSTSVGGAGAGYQDGRRLPTAWVANTAYTAGDVVRSTGGASQNGNNRYFICIIAGTSHATTEPTWPNTNLGTVTDGTVTWQDVACLYVGLVTGPASGNTYAAADTVASHSGWAESSAYSETVRQAFVPGAVSSGSCSNTSNKAVFTINATATLAGCFLCDFRTKSGVLGLLYGVGNFSGGDRAVQSGDTLNVTVTTSAS